MAGGVQAGVQAQFPAAFQNGTGKIRLEEGIPAGEGDAAARRLQKIPVTGYFLEDIIRAPEPAPPQRRLQPDRKRTKRMPGPSTVPQDSTE